MLLHRYDKWSILELRPDYRVGIVTALVRVEGVAFGLIANSSRAPRCSPLSATTTRRSRCLAPTGQPDEGRVGEFTGDGIMAVLGGRP
jgi:acetyl-CoA carboxylase carboxyltransferase component